MNRLYQGDNLDILRGIPSDSVDLIVTDPPFNTGKDWGAFKDRYEGGLDGYLEFMEQRCREMHRVLKSTGSFYLHCSPTISHYLKIMLDNIFGMNQYRNEIIWDKRFGHANDVKRKFPVLHDIIFFYSKTGSYFFSPLYKPLSEDYVNTAYRHVDEDGRRYRLNPITDTMRRKSIDQRGRTYLDETKGVSVGSLWLGNDTKLSSFSKERLGYPTQKPVALYERIIEASSEEGNLVLDPFVGSGTVLDAAFRLCRAWIGIDFESEAIEVVKARLLDQHSLRFDQHYFFHDVR